MEAKIYEKPEIKQIDLDKLKKKMLINAADAENIYMILKLTDKNLFNEQFVMDWQDRLNNVSITKDEDVL